MAFTGQTMVSKAAAQVYEAIDAREPGTSKLINVTAPKIGGYEHYIQHSVRAKLSKREDHRWRHIATWADDRIAMGDGGLLYILAAYDKQRRQWNWHCEWDCY